MKSKSKKVIGVLTLGFGAIILSSCTANFCSNKDQAQMAYPYEQGITVYCSKTDIPSDYTIVDSYSDSIGGKTAYLAIEGNDQVYKYIPYTTDDSGAVTYTAAKTTFLNSIITTATGKNLRVPTTQFWSRIDDYVLKAAITQASGVTYVDETSYASVDATFKSKITVSTVDSTTWCVNPYTLPNTDGEDENAEIIPLDLSCNTGNNSLLRRYGEMKFSSVVDEDNNTTLWGFYDTWVNELRFSTEQGLGLDGCPTTDFVTSYKSSVTSKVTSNRSCIATRDDVFGHYGTNSNWEVELEQKSWGYAWKKGFLEGLLVYPVSWLVDTFAYGMDPGLTGVGQIWAIVFVTLIIRVAMLLCTFKTTMGTQKMQALQPQLAKLQAKYPNSNTNQAEKQRLAQEQMALYKRNKIHPFSQIIVMVLQFPIFICVWSALQGSAALSSGEFLNMRLSDTIKDILFNTSGTWYLNTTGWWTALVLFILMAAAQFMSMFLPQLMTKARTKKEVTHMGKNPAQNSQAKTMKWVTYGMLVFTIIMGFFLPSAMGVYWFIGALVSMAQTVITQLIMAKNAKK